MNDIDPIDSKELVKCVSILASDADESEREMLATRSDLAERHFVRAIFAWIEALSYLFRQGALIKLKEKPLAAENIPLLSALQEKTYVINDKGAVSSSIMKASTSSMMLFSLKAFAQSQGVDLSYNKGGPNWQSYVKALNIRNRITHPKQPSDVQLSDEDVEVVREAKGMVLGYLEIVLNPKLIAIINAQREIAIREQKEISLTFTEDDLKKLVD